MKNIKKLLVFFVLVLSIILTSCENNKKVDVNITFNYGYDKQSETVKYDDFKASMLNVERNGYTLVGWYVDNFFSVKFDEKDNVTGDVTIYAKWEAIKYNINYHLGNNINNDLNPATYTIEDEVVLADPSMDGYAFKGWYSDEALTTKATKIAKGSTGNKDFYALFGKEIIITFDADGETLKTINVTAGEEVSFPTAPEKAGYTFDGWYINNEKITAIPTDKSVLIKARYNINSYSVKYFVDGNNVSVENVYYNNKANGLSQNPSKGGYEFVGWYSNAEATTPFDLTTPITKDTNLYAGFKALEYKITYNLETGVNDDANPTTFTVEDEIILKDAKKTGYKFNGWMDATGAKVEKISKGTTQSIELTASFSLMSYNINYYLDGGTNSELNPLSYTILDAFDLYDATKDGYEFLGWYPTENATTKAERIFAGSFGEFDLYAKWQTIEYAITYNLNGGTNNASNPAKYTVEDEVVFANPTKDGYTFAGWKTETGAPITKIAKGSKNPITVYATWTQDILVTFVVDNETVKIVNISNNEELTLPSNPTKEGYDFAGWYVGKAEFSTTTVVNESTIVTAKFTPKKYDVKFYVESVVYKTYEVEYNDSTNALPTDPTKNGYTFAGWYLDEAFKDEFNPKTTVITKATSVYAKFDIIEYTITYDLNGGINNSSNPNKYTIEDEVVLADATKEGYKFTGWMDVTGAPITKIEKGTTGPVTVYATWNQDIIVTFVVENETVKTVNISKNEELTLPTNPTKEGYDFVDWYVGETEFDFTTAVNESTTVTAKFTPKKFDVKFYVDGEVYKTYEVEYNNSTNALPTDPTKTGYTFGGWYLDEAFKDEFNPKTTVITKATSVYAKFDIVQYTITYDLDGGTNNSSNPAKYTVEQEVAFANPTKDGYQFGGWKTETGAPITKIEKGTTGAISLKATWTLDVIVTFVVGNETVKTVNISKNEELTLPTNPTKEGYDFSGWYVGEAEFDSTKVPTASTIVVAKFTPKKFDVKFYVGENVYETYEVEYNNSTNQLPTNPSRTGYKFVGWYLDEQFKNEFNPKTTLITKATNVYAKFDIVEYKITYDLDGGTNNPLNPTKYTIKDELVFEDPTKEGYTFTGWTGIAGEPVPKTVKGSYGDIYRKAHWALDVVVTFVVENEIVKTINISKGDDFIIPANPEKTGYDFVGWYVGEDKFNASQVFSESVTVTAKFTPKKFDVKFYVDGEVYETYEVEYNNPTSALPTDPEKTGCDFSGWYLDEDFNEEFSPKTTLITMATDVFAKFELKKITVTYYVGTTVYTTQRIDYNSIPSNLTENPKKDGYIFDDWCIDDQLKTKYDYISLTKDTNFYAKFIVSSYSITYDLNDNETGLAVNNNLNYKSYTVEEEVNFYDPTWNGYEFAGWKTQAGKTITKIEKGSVGNITIVANWTIVEYQIDYHLDADVTNPDSNPVEYTIETDTITLADATKSGYKFEGWYSDANFGTKVTQIVKGTTGKIDLYAKFTKATSNVNVIEYQAGNETIYFKIDIVDGVDINDYRVYYSTGDGYVKIDSQLVRFVDEDDVDGVNDYVRADIVGLSAGTYKVKVEIEDGEAEYSNIKVSAQDRSGYAHFNYTNGVGAYNDDGTLKANTKVIYVNNDTKNTVKATIGGQERTGLVDILTNLKDSSTPVCVRFIEEIQTAQWNSYKYQSAEKTAALFNEQKESLGGKTENLTKEQILAAGYNSYSNDLSQGITVLEGLKSDILYSDNQYDSYFNMCDIEGASNITIEGIGITAGLYQWGLTFKKCNSIEVRNLFFDNYQEDAIGIEGGSSNSDIDYGNYWIHNCTFEQGKNNWDLSYDQDKGDGDGSTDFKRAHNLTISYCFYYCTHKSNLIGANNACIQYNITLHHNYYDSCELRLPLVRHANIHMYNNYYHATVSHGISVRANAYAFIENNYFDGQNPFMLGYAVKDSNNPVGTTIKAINNSIHYTKLSDSSDNGAALGVDGIYVLTKGDEKTYSSNLEATRTTKSVGSVCKPDGVNDYTNFDTNRDLFYYDAVFKRSDVAILNDADDVQGFVPTHAGAGDALYESLNLGLDTTPKYKVNFMLETESSLETLAYTYVKENAKVVSYDFEYEGYQFVNWYADANLTTLFDFDSAITKDTNIYAKAIEAEKHQISFVYVDEYGKENEIGVEEVYDGSKVSKPSNPTLSGYEFKGWYNEASFETEFDFTKAITASDTVYAKFEKLSEEGFVIKFNDVATGDKTESFDISNATVKASSSKSVNIANCTETVDGISINRVLKLGGTADANARSIHFTLTKKANITAYYKSANTSEQRKLALYNSNGKVDDFELAGNDIVESELTNVSAGAYYIGSANSGVNVYLIKIEYLQDQVQDTLQLNYYVTARNTQKNTTYNNGQYIANHVKTLYKVGDSADYSYLTVTDEYVAATNNAVAITGFDSETAGTKNITVTYGNDSATYQVYVLPANFTISSDDSGYYVVAAAMYENQVGGTATIDGKTYTTFKTINQALDAFELCGITPTASKRAYLKLLADYYNEKVVIKVPYLTIEGKGYCKATYDRHELYDENDYDTATIIEWDSLYGLESEGKGVIDKDHALSYHTTDSTQTVYIMESAVNCEIKNLTISNAWNCEEMFTDNYDSLDGKTYQIYDNKTEEIVTENLTSNGNVNEHRALALLVQGDMAMFDSVALLGYQDTVEFFTGRSYLNKCFITGATDYIFGTNGTTYIYDSVIHTIYNGKSNQGGFVNAFKGQNIDSNDAVTYGCIYDDCTFEADSNVTDYTVALGRPWTTSSSVMIMNSTISEKYSKAPTTSSSSGRYCDWNSSIKASNSKFYEYSNSGLGAISASITGCTVLTETAAANYGDFSVIFAKTNGGVTYNDAWDGKLCVEKEDTNIYYYFDGTTSNSSTAYTYSGTVEGSNTTFNGMTIDATSGKLYARGSDTQMNAGTKITFTVTKDSTVTITFNHYQEAYTVNGVASTSGTYSIDVTAGTEIVFIATATSYLKSIIIS